MPIAPPRTLARRLLAAAEVLSTPVLPERYVQLVDPTFSTTGTRGRVVSVADETPGVVTVTIRPGAGWTRHAAGQHVRLGLEVDGVRQWRTFTISSAPERADGDITVTVKALAGGKVTPWLREGLHPGALVRLDGPSGDFRLPAVPGPLPLLLVTGGSGITPALSMVRSLAARVALLDVVHLHCAPSAADAICRDELRALAAAHPGYRYLEHLDDESDGFLTPEAVVARVPDALDRGTYVCGPTPLLASLEQHWADAGASDRFHLERFAAPRPTGAAGAGGTVTFTASGVSATSDGSVSLLDAGESAGALLPNGCRMGVCFTCVGPLRSGAVRDLRDGTVSDSPGQTVQTCVSAPEGDCEVDL